MPEPPQQPYKPYVPSRNLDFKPLFAGAPVSPDFIKRKGSSTSVESQQLPSRSGSLSEEKETTPPPGDEDHRPDTTATPIATKQPMVAAEMPTPQQVHHRAPSPPAPSPPSPPPTEHPSSSPEVPDQVDPWDGEMETEKARRRRMVQTLAPVVPMVEFDFDGLLSMDERLKFFGG
jgi:hypothetical protein